MTFPAWILLLGMDPTDSAGSTEAAAGEGSPVDTSDHIDGSDQVEEVNPDTASLSATKYRPPHGVIETIRAKYAIGIITLLGDAGPLRYGEIKARVDAPSDATLSQRLQQLTAEDILTRHHYDEIPPRVEYSLTPTGRELEDHLKGLLTWAASVDAR